MIHRNRIVRRLAEAAIVASAGATLTAGAEPLAIGPLTRYQTPAAVIESDLPSPAVREAGLRLQALRPVLADPAWGFPGGVAVGNFDVEWFARATDFQMAEGGAGGIAGMFLPGAVASPGCAPGRVLALAGPVLTLQTWHVLQHEATHQFAFAALQGRFLPPWLDEGLAEYVGEGLFTGDSYVLGVIPPWRLARLQTEIRAGTLPTLAGVLGKSPQEWSLLPSVGRYDQVWSLVHFLKNAGDGKYAPLLAGCVRDGSDRGLPADLELQWRGYWLSQPPNPTADRYVECVRETLTSFLVRATAAGQRFGSFAEFRQVAEQGKLAIPVERWLPPGLLKESLDAADAMGTWELVDSKTGPRFDLLPRK